MERSKNFLLNILVVLLFVSFSCSSAHVPPAPQQSCPVCPPCHCPCLHQQTPPFQPSSPPTYLKSIPPPTQQSSPPPSQPSTPPSYEKSIPPPSHQTSTPPSHEKSTPPTQQYSSPPSNLKSTPPPPQQYSPPPSNLKSTPPPPTQKSSPPPSQPSTPPSNLKSTPPPTQQSSPPPSRPSTPPSNLKSTPPPTQQSSPPPSPPSTPPSNLKSTPPPTQQSSPPPSQPSTPPSNLKSTPPPSQSSTPPSNLKSTPPPTQQSSPPPSQPSTPPSNLKSPPPPTQQSSPPPSQPSTPPSNLKSTPPPTQQSSPPPSQPSTPPSNLKNTPPPTQQYSSPPSNLKSTPPPTQQSSPPPSNLKYTPPPAQQSSPPYSQPSTPPTQQSSPPPSNLKYTPPPTQQSSPPYSQPSTPPSQPSTPPSPSSFKVNIEFQNCFSNVYSFGDSSTDTGNGFALGVFKSFADIAFSKSFYFSSSRGELEGHRLSNGRLIVDYLCQTLNVPTIQPYKSASLNFSASVNFAIAGSSCLSSNYFLGHSISYSLMWKQVPTSFMTEIEWFNKFLREKEFTMGRLACQAEMEKTLFWVGGVGSNDFARLHGSSIAGRFISEIIINHISRLLKSMLSRGARYIVVQGLPPAGCTPLDLSLCAPRDRDQSGCSASTNAIISAHNELLQRTLVEFRQQYTGVVISYADTWGAYYYILANYKKYNLEEPFKACCGSDGVYNFDLHSLCGSTGSSTCQDSSKYISWDGVHFTETMNAYIADLFFNKQGYCKPSFSELIKAKKGSK